MGNLCIREYERPIYNKNCVKCGDTFKPSYGGRSHRRSCRKHVFKLNTCIYCGKKINSGGWNCYHSVYKN